MTLALIDGDIIAYRAAAGVKQKFKWEDDEPASVSSEGNPEMAREAALLAVRSWASSARAKDVLVCFSGPRGHNFRKIILPSYKMHRAGTAKPTDYWATVDAVRDQYPTQIIEGLEADDLLGILATTDKYADRAVILSQDKDLRTIPGRILNPIKESCATLVSERDADRWWLTQTLTGDATDGYRGIPGVGPAKAAAILGPPSSASLEALWAKVVSAYRRAGLTEDDALTQARCARILRRQDYDKTTKDILLWHPLNPTRLGLATVCGASAAVH